MSAESVAPLHKYWAAGSSMNVWKKMMQHTTVTAKASVHDWVIIDVILDIIFVFVIIKINLDHSYFMG